MVSAYVFDAYGTLFDVHAAIARHRAAAGPDADRFSDIWRTKQLEYTWTLTLAGHYVDFWTLTERALDFAFARVPSVDRGLRPRLLEAYRTLDAFPDAHAALAALKARGLRASHSLQRYAVDAVGRRGGRGNGRIPRRGSVGRRRSAIQAATGRLPACHRRFCARAIQCRLRFVEPLGRDGCGIVRNSRHTGSIASPCRTNMRTLRRCAGSVI